MKKWFLTIVIISSIISISFAQNHVFEWAKPLKGTGHVICNSVITDSIGNIYTIGEFSDTIDFDPSPDTLQLISNGESDIFIHKSDSSGNFLWVKQLGGSLHDYGTDIKLDNNGNVYCTGSFKDTVFSDQDPILDSLVSIGISDFYIYKLDSSGNSIWIKQIGGISYVSGKSISHDLEGNILITGIFQDSADFDPGINTSYLYSAGLNDMFIIKLDEVGNFLWVKQIGGTHTVISNAIEIDSSGNIYTTGYFEGDYNAYVDFDPGPDSFLLDCYGVYDAFVLKLDSSGNYQWAKRFGNMAVFPLSMNIDVYGDVYIAGEFSGQIIINIGDEIETVETVSTTDMFVLKMDTQGNPLWIKQTGATEHDIANSIISDSMGNVYILGSFKGTVDFDSGPDTINLTSNGNKDISIQKLDALGNLLWVKQIGGNSYDKGASITFDIFGNIITVGKFKEAVDFDPGSDTMFLYSNEQFSGFIQKLKPCSSNLITPNNSNLPDLTGQCTIPSPALPTAENECDEIFVGVPNVTFPITDQSITEVIWSYNGWNGNSTTQSQNIIWDLMNITTITTGLTITANNENVSYQWVSCDDDYTLIEGENQQSFTATENGNYAVIIDNGICIDTSDCVNITSVNINNIRNSGIVLMPNPVENILIIKSTKTINTLELIDNSARTIKHFKTNVNTYKMDMYDLVSGIYYIKIITNNFVRVEKVIKQ